MKKFGILLVIMLCILMAKGKNTDAVSVEIVDKDKVITVSIDNKVQEMDFEQYIMGVVYGEMYARFDIEALKAQAVTARTYAYNKIINGGCKNSDMCDDINHCQAYKEVDKEHYDKIKQAVYDTKGEIITFNDEPIIALFHSTSGGKTEDNVNVFGSDLPYLKSVESKNEEDAKNYTSTKTFSTNEIKNKIQKAYGKTSGESITVESRYDSGRVEKVNVFGMSLSGKQLRETLGLYSANFEVEKSGDSYTFYVKGYGHGVGLSQVGANAMAQRGSDYKDIIKHYYTGVDIQKINW